MKKLTLIFLIFLISINFSINAEMVTRGEYLEFDRGDPHSCIKIIPPDWTEEDFNKVVEAYEIALKLYSEKNYIDAITIFEALHKIEYSSATNILAHFYLEGLAGIKQDTLKAIRLLERSVNFSNKVLRIKDKGYCAGSAPTTLGYIYMTGEYPDVQKDYNKALRWNRLGAEYKHTNAFSNLAMMYASGFGVKQDFNKTVEYLIQSIESYESYASFILNEPDEWKIYLNDIENKYWMARDLYWMAIKSDEEKYLLELKSMLRN